MLDKQIGHVDLKTPIGELRIFGSNRELHRVIFSNDKNRDTGIGIIIRDIENFPAVGRAYNFIADYFNGKVDNWKINSPLNGTEFRVKVWEELAKIPFGSTISYSELAALAGNPGAARAVGSAMANNPIPILVPCHRVLHADGGLGGFGGGLDVKKWLLNFEWENSRK